MTLNDSTVLFYTLAFIVPGFILDSVISSFVPQKDERLQILFLRFLTLSCFNYAVWSWLIFLMVQKEMIIRHPFWIAFLWGLIIFVSPICLGLMIGYFSRSQKFQKIFEKIGYNIISSIPTAWDYKFWSIREHCVWVLITLSDDSQVAGLFGSSSFAASYRKGKDIYLQTVYKISDDGIWEEVQDSDGIIIDGEDIKYIEFWSDPEEINNEKI